MDSKARSKAYYEAHKDTILQKRKLNYQANKALRAAYKAAHYREDLEAHKARKKAYTQSPKGRLSMKAKDERRRDNPKYRALKLYCGAKKRALKYDLEFSIDKCGIETIIKAGFCTVTGLPFVIGPGRSPWAPSLDRTDPTLGYTKQNTKVVVYIYNICKSDFKHDDIIRLSKAVLERACSAEGCLVSPS